MELRSLPHEVRDRILAIANRDQMEMVGHEGVSSDPDVALLGVLLDEVQEALPIGVGGKDRLFIVAALGEVEPVTRRGEAKSAGLIVPSMYSGFRRQKISLIFEKNARRSLKIRTTMAASHLLSVSYPQTGPPRGVCRR